MKTWQKTIAVIATFALLTNSLAAPFTILAQEVTPTPEATSTPEATIAPTSEPSASPTTTPVDLVTPTPEVTPTAEPSFTPIPSDQPIQTQAPESNPTTQGPPEQTNSSIPSATPTATPEASVENGELLVTILENTKATSVEQVLEGFDLNYEQTETSATLITDKADYAPTDAVLITGTGFTPNETYKLVITSEDEPKVNFEDQVIANDKGEIIYIYQLDGNYRPNYKVQAFDLSEVLIATVTFTDSDTGFKSPSATGNPNEWSNGSSAYSSNDSYANTNDDDDNQGYRNFGFSGLSGSTINGIEIKLEARQEGTTCELQVRLSGNNGSNHTNRKTLVPTNSDTILTYGGASDLWDDSWSANNFTDANFKVEIRYNDPGNGCSNNNDDIFVDHVQAKIHYTEANTPPVITEGASTSVTMSVNGSPTPFSLTLNATDSDLPAQTLTWSISSNASHGTASVSGTGSSKSISYTPTTNYIGTDSFNVRVSDGNGGTDTITVNVTINPYIVSNPGLAQSCGIDVALVVDTSTSIDNTELGQMKTALKGFINTLIGTPTRMAVVSFDDVANIESNFTDDLSSLSAANGVIDDIDGSGYTNWEDAIQETRAIFPDRTDKPDLIIFTSDGNPTASNTGGANDTSQPNSHLAPAITQANSAKGDGIRIITLGIGSDVDANRLKQISSDDAYYSAANFSSLATTLEELVTDLCGGTVTVNKQVDSDGDGGYEGGNTEANTLDFNWDIDSETLNRNMGTTLDDVEAGNHTILESSVSGYTFTGWYYSNDTEYSCTNPRGTTLPINITTTDNSITSITLCNAQQKGHLVVQKTTIPAGDATEFSITATGSGTITGGGSGTVTDSQDKTYEVTPGTYSVSESALSGWKETGNTCTSITVSAGETEYCTITNTKLGSISGYKYEDQDGKLSTTGDRNGVAGWIINLYKWITSNWTFVTSTTTDVNGFYNFTDLLPGKYEVREEDKSGWVNLTDDVLDFWVSAGENETGKNFINTEKGKIIIKKVTIPSDSQQSFKFDPSWSTSNFYLKDGQSTEKGNLMPGKYSIKEIVPDGWTLTSATCSDGSNPSNISLQSGEIITCTFTNTRDTGKVTIIKKAINHSNENFRFTTNLPGVGGDFELEDDGHDNNGGTEESITFKNVPTGSYWVKEDFKDGWKMTKLSCTGDRRVHYDDRKVTIDLDKNENVVCTYENTELAKISGYKFNDKDADGHWDLFHGEFGLGNWKIFIDKNENGEYNFGEKYDWTSSSLFNRGYYEFKDLLPGKYTVCEELKSDWTNTTPLCQEVWLKPGEVDHFVNFGNIEEDPSIEITKMNEESTIIAGGGVLYTVTITNTGNIPVMNVKISDVLPGGFSYVYSSTTGDTTSDPIVTGNILTWDIGTLGGGESFTVHYEAGTSSDLSDGIYTNFADCRAFTRSQKEIFCDPAASSTVRIGSSAGYSGSLGGQVLGASTELPATGSPTWVLIGSLMTLTSGLFLNICSKKGRRTYGKK